MSEIHDDVVELCQIHVQPSFYDIGYEIKWEIHEVIMLISCLDSIVVLLWVLWEIDDIHGSYCLIVRWVFMIWISEVLLWLNEENYLVVVVVVVLLLMNLKV